MAGQSIACPNCRSAIAIPARELTRYALETRAAQGIVVDDSTTPHYPTTHGLRGSNQRGSGLAIIGAGLIALTVIAGLVVSGVALSQGWFGKRSKNAKVADDEKKKKAKKVTKNQGKKPKDKTIQTPIKKQLPDDPRRVINYQGGFSYIPPKGWKTGFLAGSNYPALFGPKTKGTAPTIGYIDVQDGNPLNKYVENEDSTMQLLPTNRFLGRTSFATAGGLNGYRSVFRNDILIGSVRQVRYTFADGSRKFSILATMQGAVGDMLDPIFDAFAKSFRFEKR